MRVPIADSGLRAVAVIHRAEEGLRKISVALILLSVAGVVYSMLFFDFTVDAPGVGRVANLSLMQHQRNLLLLSCGVGVGAVILFGFSRPGVRRGVSIGSRRGEDAHVKACQFCAESIRREASLCRYCGKEQAKSPVGHRPVEGQEEMMRAWGVQLEDGSYVVGDYRFPTLLEAIVFAKKAPRNL
ncbi:hypothetical protein [Roseateles sp. LKC17W]|uniref:Zinc ribbon domain-containing protein n=1 Tax=Pelomonas margarita TaxID=3299031 RepID=A0ABW7FQA7_9BURK